MYVYCIKGVHFLNLYFTIACAYNSIIIIMAQMFEREDKNNGSIQFLLKESTKYQKGQYAIQLSYYKCNVYLHLLGKLIQ